MNNTKTGVAQDSLLSDVDGDDMKALRAWMMRVNTALEKEGLVGNVERSEMHELVCEATGWDDV